MSATTLAAEIKQGRLTCVAVMESVLARIDALNPALNAASLVMSDGALRSACQADAALVRGDAVGPLHGVPFTIKEALDLAGFATTDGLPSHRHRLARQDAPIVRQLKHAGAIPVARTNMSEGAVRWQSESGLFGATRNPWDFDRTVGGSCGGSAVAVAVGMGPLSVGNDIGGSLRQPAQCCGVASLKPSFGRVAVASSTRKGDPSLVEILFGADGIMAREAADLRLALQAVSGPDSRDPWWVPAPLTWPQILPKRVALTLESCGPRLDPDVAAGVERAAEALAGAGYAVARADPPRISDMAQLWRRFMVAQVSLLRPPRTTAEYMAQTRKYLELQQATAPKVTKYTLMELLAERGKLIQSWGDFFDIYPMVLGPVSTEAPFVLGADLANAEAVAALFECHRLTLAANVLGLPAVVVPVMRAGRMPIVAQIIARPYREDLCLDTAEAIERSVGPFVPLEEMAAANVGHSNC
jgi:amidase